jgi:DnaJ-class molecular chaperone
LKIDLTASDLTYLINEMSHKDYQRVGNDVFYTANITLAQALGKEEGDIGIISGCWLWLFLFLCINFSFLFLLIPFF